MSDLSDVLGEETKTTTKAKPAKAKAAKPKTEKPAAKAKPAKAAPAAKAKPAKAEKAAKPRVKANADVSTAQPEDKVVIAAVRKLKEPTLAAQFAASLGVHRRVIRGQLQRLAKDKANGVAMKKDGFNWYVSAK